MPTMLIDLLPWVSAAAILVTGVMYVSMHMLHRAAVRARVDPARVRISTILHLALSPLVAMAAVVTAAALMELTIGLSLLALPLPPCLFCTLLGFRLTRSHDVRAGYAGATVSASIFTAMGVGGALLAGSPN